MAGPRVNSAEDSQLCFRASCLKFGERVPDLRHFHSTQVPKDFVVPVRRTAPGEEEGSRHKKVGFHWDLCWGKERKELSPTLVSLSRGRVFGSEPRGEAGIPVLVPEVSTADMSKARAAQATGLHEVLGGKHEGAHSRLWHRLLRIQGLGDKEAPTTRKV